MWACWCAAPASLLVLSVLVLGWVGLSWSCRCRLLESGVGLGGDLVVVVWMSVPG